LRRKDEASARISAENVAENKRFWRAGGNAEMILRMSRMKPMSSMRSASSSTSVSTLSRRTVPCCMWSSRRPGVATTMSTPRRNSVICGPMPTPPKITVERKGRNLP
jgi:hypothetical protein